MTHMDPHAKRKVVWIGAVLAPIVSVQAVRLLDGPGPAAAPAALTPATPDVPPDQAVAPVKPLTDAQKRALTFLAAYAPPADLRSPMDAPDPVAAPPEPAKPAPRVDPAPETPHADPLANLSVSAIVGTEDAAVAMISHRLRRVGDEVAPGWTVGAIDTRRRHVVLSGPEGRTATLTPPTPGQ